jgi:aminopeptidase N
MYYKGANMLHTIRQLINDDEKWRQILRGLNKEFYHQTVTTKQIENYISEKSSIDLSKVFDQYLRTAMIPLLEYKLQENGAFSYRYTNVIEGFNMPLKIEWDNEMHEITPTEKWQQKKLESTPQQITVDRNYYVDSKKIAH